MASDRTVRPRDLYLLYLNQEFTDRNLAVNPNLNPHVDSFVDTLDPTATHFNPPTVNSIVADQARPFRPDYRTWYTMNLSFISLVVAQEKLEKEDRFDHEQILRVDLLGADKFGLVSCGIPVPSIFRSPSVQPRQHKSPVEPDTSNRKVTLP